MKKPFLLIAFVLGSLSASAFTTLAGRVWTDAPDTSVRDLHIHLVVQNYPASGDSLRVQWGDATELLIPLTDFNRLDTVALGFEVYYDCTHTFMPGDYYVSVDAGNRLNYIANIWNSGNTQFLLTTNLTIDPNIGQNTTPLSDSLFLICDMTSLTGNVVPMNVIDADGDSITWTTVATAPNYFFPSTVGGGMFSYTIGAQNFDWDPGFTGVYAVMFMFEEWHVMPNGDTLLIGWTIREVLIVVDNSIGISSMESSHFSFYPNPAANEIHFSEPVEELVITNLQGEMVIAMQNTSEVDVSSLAQGLYLISINGLASRRVVIAR